MNENQQENSELQARRKLLKAAVYIPPAVLGFTMIGSTPANAYTLGVGSFGISAASNTCGPCNSVLTAPGVPLLSDLQDCLKDQCTKNCINCDNFIANGASWGKTTCDKCEKVLKSGCSTTCNQPIVGVCTCTNKNANKPKKKPKWKCKPA
ncbi:MAG: hypothetical protein R8M46_06050 [Ghiorsea sp.]